MHLIEDDLELDAWIAAGLAKLEEYLEHWAAFASFMADRG